MRKMFNIAHRPFPASNKQLPNQKRLFLQMWAMLPIYLRGFKIQTLARRH